MPVQRVGRGMDEPCGSPLPRPTNLSQVRRSELPNRLPDKWKQLQSACPTELESSATLPS
jgi:hypothetical protein